MTHTNAAHKKCITFSVKHYSCKSLLSYTKQIILAILKIQKSHTLLAQKYMSSFSY